MPRADRYTTSEVHGAYWTQAAVNLINNDAPRTARTSIQFQT